MDFAKALEPSGNAKLSLYTESKTLGFRETESLVIASNPVNHELKVSLKGLQATSVSNLSASSATSLEPERLCFRMDTQPDLGGLDNQQILDYCTTHSGSNTIDRDRTVEEVELACFSLLAGVLRNMSVEQILSSKPHLFKYWQWMNHQMDRHENGSLIHG